MVFFKKHLKSDAIILPSEKYRGTNPTDFHSRNQVPKGLIFLPHKLGIFLVPTPYGGRISNVVGVNRAQDLGNDLKYRFVSTISEYSIVPSLYRSFEPQKFKIDSFSGMFLILLSLLPSL